MDRGRILAAGSPEEIRASHNARVRQFLERTSDPRGVDPSGYLSRIVGSETMGSES